MRSYYIIVDLEGTCCDQPDASIPPDERETIEIGAVMIDCERREVASEFQSFVRPIRNPKLTDFCIALTKIQQSDVDRAPKFQQAFTSFGEWARKCSGFASWGRYDREQFQRDCQFHRVTYPFSWHVNFAGVTKKELGSITQRRVLKMLGIERSGIHHRGIDDARNIAQIAIALLRRGWQPE